MIDVESTESKWYTRSMSRPPTNREKKSEKLTAKVTPTLKGDIAEVMEREDRTESYIAYAFLLRGLAAYRRDGKLFEPDDATKSQGIGNQESDWITVRKRVGGRPTSQKRKTGSDR